MCTDDARAIDAVITWVDGKAPEHLMKRAQYVSAAIAPLHENAVNPHRWADSDEIFYCLQSIENNAPWIRTIWIVADGRGPDLSRLSRDLRARIRVVDHREIFKGFEAALPTFNSLAIESLIWRIEGLSEYFLYFNDDVFLTAPLSPEDVFRGNKPVLRGKWVDNSHLTGDAVARSDPALFNRFMQMNAAQMLGVDPCRIFAAAHVVHPMRRSVMADLFAHYPQAFAENIGHRFRDIRQFLPMGLHNHACINRQGAVMHPHGDHLHIRSGQGLDQDPQITALLLQGIADTQIKFLCVNDLPQLEQVVPDARMRIAGAIGGTPSVPPA
ncbi:Stealth protein CR2, conserved region 2 [Jannaschia faecimaris]|uniref:Stealth protein CR2, conserved region 2 n=1 Tax=Jannaschia faecimaris TaxID=1244108 RepID=A0A1H3LEB0_9RHOB|nr:hypothetical protein [Jannaschia faecimaris]SDY62743.1 Stealth protein CR2, conserved region 2 [Jannaschia faecimaris]